MHRSILIFLFFSFFVFSFFGFLVGISYAGELIYSTYLGGFADDYGFSIAIDSSGNAYIAGSTYSSNFPTTPGAWDTNCNGIDCDIFITKLNPSGTGLVYSTHLGGINNDFGNHGIAIDTIGNAYITGYTYSSDFPTTPGAWDTTRNSIYADAFVTKLNQNGTNLIYSTYLGGSDWDYGSAITVDTLGNAYIIGDTESSDFPTTLGALNINNNGTCDVFISKFNANGTDLIYSTYLGGCSVDYCGGIALDTIGNAYITGSTYSSDFPTTVNALDTSLNGGYDVFVCKLNPIGTELAYSTYFGGTAQDIGCDIALDAIDNVYITGYSSSSNFPTTVNAWDTSINGKSDIFVSKLNLMNNELIFSTYLGGCDIEYGHNIAIDGLGNAFITGVTASLDFPTTSDAFDTTYHEGIISKLNPNGSRVVYSTYFGGSGDDSVGGIVSDLSGNIYIVGSTSSPDFPTTPGAFDTIFDEGGTYNLDAFVSKLYINPFLNTHGAFSTNNDTSYWYFGKYDLALDSGVLSWSSTKQNIAITQSPGQKAKLSQRFSIPSPGWYTAIARVATNIIDITKQQKVYLYLQEFNQDNEIIFSCYEVIFPGNGGFGTASIWRDIEISFYAQSTNLGVQVVVINPQDTGVSGSVYLNDIWVYEGAPYVRSSISLSNPSFDDGTTGWILEPYSNASYAGYWTGDWSVLALTQDGGMKGKASQLFHLSSAMKPVSVSAWVYSDATTVNETQKVYASLYAYDSGYTKIIESGNAILQPGKWTPNEWHQIQFEFIPSTNYNAVQLIGINPIGNPWSTIYFDDVEVKQ
jgi:hypothetical protein